MSTLCTIKQFAEAEPAFPESSTRWIIYRAADKSSLYTKFAPAIHRIGRSVFIDEPQFIAIAKNEG